MAYEIVDALQEELGRHGCTGFRTVVGTKHDRFYFTHDGVEKFHIISKGGSEINQRRMLALQDVRRMIGVNQGSGPRERTRHEYQKKREPVPTQAAQFSVMPDPMEILAPLKEKLEMRQSTEEAAPIVTIKHVKKNAEFEMPKPSERDRSWLNEMLTRGEKERLHIVRRKITPGLAAAMLELNIANRPVVEKQVRMHEQRLKRGDWLLTHQGLAFARTRVLNDGQHRLLAIARTGIMADISVTFGCEREEFKVIDGGRTRGARDIVGITIKDAPVLRASIARIILMAETNNKDIDPTLVAERAITMHEKPTTEIALRLAWSLKKVCNPSPVAAAYCWITMNSPNAVRANEFFDKISSGEGLSGVKLRFREWLWEKSLDRAKAAGNEGVWRTAGIILAWNGWLAGKQKITMDWRKYLELPVPN